MAALPQRSSPAVPDHHVLTFLRIPYEVLIALSDRHLHFQMQPYHHLIRMAHIFSASAFFGAILMLDARLIGTRSTLPLRSLAQHALPWIYAAFAVAFASGVALFAYNPVRVGSHAYFTPKLGFILLGLMNAALFHRTSYRAALTEPARMPASARIAGGVSLLLWTAVIVCACLNTEPAPRVLLR